MSETLAIALINLVAKVGLDAAIAITEGLKKSATLDDAIAALRAAKTKTAQDYLDEASRAVAAPVVS